MIALAAAHALAGPVGWLVVAVLVILGAYWMFGRQEYGARCRFCGSHTKSRYPVCRKCGRDRR
jgi:hypothetical protein